MYSFSELFDSDFSFNKYPVRLNSSSVTDKYMVTYNGDNGWVFYKSFNDKKDAMEIANRIIEYFGYDTKIVDIQDYIGNTEPITVDELINVYSNVIIDILNDFADNNINIKKGFITPNGGIIKVNNIHSFTDELIVKEIEKQLNVHITDYEYDDMISDFFCIRINSSLVEQYVSVYKELKLTSQQLYTLSDWIDNIYIASNKTRLQVICGNDYAYYDLSHCDGSFIVNEIRKCLNGRKLSGDKQIW